MISTGFLFGCALLALLAAPQAGAQTPAPISVPNHPALTDRFAIEIGGFYSNSTTLASLSPSAGGVGVIVDFEDTLGLEARNMTPVLGFLWRFSERWRLEMEYFELSRAASRALGSRVDWGDQVFPPGSMIQTRFDFSDMRVSAGYSFFKRPDKELGVGFGLHMAGIDASLQAGGIGAQSAEVLAPLPVLNFYGLFALTNEWALRTRLDWLSLSAGPYSGDVRNMAIDVLYQPFRNVGFGLGVRSLVMDVEIDKDDWRGKARVVFGGPTVFTTITF